MITTGRWSEVCRSVFRGFAVLATLNICYCAYSAAQQSFKIEPSGPPRHEISRELQNRLNQDGVRLLRTVNGVDIPLAELWWVKDLIVRPAKNTAGDGYAQLKPGTMLAVLYLPAEIDDVSLRKTPPGVYTLRYSELAPGAIEDEEEDEDEGRDEKPHLERDYHDFVFLSSIESEGHTTARRAATAIQGVTREKRPMLALVPWNPAYRTFPDVVSDDQGRCAVQFTTSVRLASGRNDSMHISVLLINPPDLSKDD